MKKLSLLLVIALLVATIMPTNAMAADFNESVGSIENVVTVTGKNGEELVFFKDGLYYKVLRENGDIEVWAQDYIITSQSEINTKNVASANDSVWKYLQTDKYKTNINYEVLNAILTAADAITQLSVALGVTVAIAAYIISYRPTAVYRIDDSYSYIYDPLYWRIDSKIYKNSDFTGLIDSFTSYIQWNS